MAEPAAFFPLSDELFGRQPDLDFLLQRVRAPGVTFVTARPKMGKTWLLLAAAQKLGDPFLVGYHECTGGEELFRYAVQDLYTRWLGQASLRQQALEVWDQQKDGWISKAGGAVAAIFGGVGKLTGGIPDGVADVVKGAMDGLISANARLKSGDLDLPVLAYDQGKELLAGLAKMSGSPIVLIFDAWEKAGALDREHDFLEAYLQHRADWPPVHFLVGLRTPALAAGGAEPAALAAEDIRKSSASAAIYPLAPLHLDPLPERERLLTSLRRRLPAAGAVPDLELLAMLNSYPGTLERWTEQPQLATAAELKREADDAEQFLYRELDRLLPALSGSNLTFVVRLALLPRLSAEMWQVYQAVVMEGIEADTPWNCCERGLLTDGEVPTFGHDTRHHAVGRWLMNSAGFSARLRKEANRLITRFGPQIDFVSPGTPILSAAIRSAFRLVGEGLGPLPRLIAQANRAFWDENPGAGLLTTAPWPGTGEDRQRLASFLGRALYNTIIDACRAKDLPLATGLLAVLRALQHDFPDQELVRQRFAAMLVDAVELARNCGDEVAADAWFDELRELNRNSAPDGPVLREYGYALQNATRRSQQRQQFEPAERSAAEFIALLTASPTSLKRRGVAEALQSFVIQGAHLGQKPAVIAEWLQHVRSLCAEEPASAELRVRLGSALSENGMTAREKGAVEISDPALLELEQLYRQFPEEPLAESLARLAAVEIICTPTPYVLTDSARWLTTVQQLRRAFPRNEALAKLGATLQTTLAEKLRTFGPKDPLQLNQSLAQLAAFTG